MVRNVFIPVFMACAYAATLLVFVTVRVQATTTINADVSNSATVTNPNTESSTSTLASGSELPSTTEAPSTAAAPAATTVPSSTVAIATGTNTVSPTVSSTSGSATENLSTSGTAMTVSVASESVVTTMPTERTSATPSALNSSSDLGSTTQASTVVRDGTVRDNSTSSASTAAPPTSPLSSVTSVANSTTAGAAGGIPSSPERDVIQSSTERNVETTTVMLEISTQESLCSSNLNPCKNKGTCQTEGDAVTCNCTANWAGVNCTEDVNECTGTAGICNNMTSDCRNTDGDYECDCRNGFISRTSSPKQCVDVDECLLAKHDCDTVTQICINTFGGYNCTCATEDDYVAYNETCERRTTAKAELIVNETWHKSLDDKNSALYKAKVSEISKSVRAELENDNQVHKLAVTDFREGSIIATVLFQLTLPVEVHLSNISNLVLKTLEDADYCEFNRCDAVSTICEGYANLNLYICKCKKDFEAIRDVTDRCQYSRACHSELKPCKEGQTCSPTGGEYSCKDNSVGLCPRDVTLCHNDGECVPLEKGGFICRCADGFSGKKCEDKTVEKATYEHLERILIGVGVGLGSLAFFCSIALIIICCSDRSRGDKGSDYSPVIKKSGHHYGVDDVTIESWEPSLPRPKLKPGIFGNHGGSSDEMEMNEKRASADDEQEQRAAGAENPAFIPEADYDGDGRTGRLVANGKKGAGDFVYF